MDRESGLSDMSQSDSMRQQLYEIRPSYSTKSSNDTLLMSSRVRFGVISMMSEFF
jgi:hypothetical protein